jgi:arylsulfatase
VPRGRTRFDYPEGTTRIPEASAPDTKNRSWSVTARVLVPDGPADGVLATLGGRFGGWGLLVLGGKPVFAYALSNQEKDRVRVRGQRRLAPGRHIVRVDFAYDGGGIGKGAMATLVVDGRRAGEARIPRTARFRFSASESFDVGADTGTPVVDDYRPPFANGGKREALTIELKDDSAAPQ